MCAHHLHSSLHNPLTFVFLPLLPLLWQPHKVGWRTQLAILVLDKPEREGMREKEKRYTILPGPFESSVSGWPRSAGLCLQCTLLGALECRMSVLGREEDSSDTSLGRLSAMGEAGEKNLGHALS